MADIQSTLDLIDGALGDYLSVDAMRWTPDESERAESNPEPHGRSFRDAFGSPGERIPYQFLSDDEREALHAWVELHGVDHTTVPIEGPISFDASTSEWLIEVFKQRDGNSYLDEDGQVAREVLRRPHRADLPWPVFGGDR